MRVDNLCVNGVQDKFRKIPSKVRISPICGSTKKYLGAWNPITKSGANRRLIKWPDYTSSLENEMGLGEHFQGIQRIGKYLILSGGIKTGKKSSQFITIEMGSKEAIGPWALPRYGSHYKKPRPNDRIVRVFDVDPILWHGGGIQAMGDIIAVPIFGNVSDSEIRYFDFSNPLNDPSELVQTRITRNGEKSNAVALTRLPNDFFMTLVWDDKNLDFYISQSTDIRNGFQHNHKRVKKEEVRGGFQPGTGGLSGFGTYQNINFVRDCDGTIFFVATRNQERASPALPGNDYADLYKVTWPNGYNQKPEIIFKEQKQMYCYNQQCNFGAGAGIYVDDDQHLYLYGASHWLHGKNSRVNFNEYAYV